MRYRLKPTEVEAFQFTRSNSQGGTWPDWLIEAWNKNKERLGAFYLEIERIEKGKRAKFQYWVNTPDGSQPVEFGNYIIRESNGDLYCCNLERFKKLYEEAEW